MAKTKIPLNPGSGPLAVAVDRIAGDDFELVKLTLGAIGTDDGPVSATNPMPVKIDQTTPGTTNAVVSATKPYTNTANQSTAYTGTAGTSAAVNAATTQVIVILTTDGYIAFGSAPTATTSDMFLPAYVPSPPMAVTGGTTKVSAIRDANSGTMKIAEYS